MKKTSKIPFIIGTTGHRDLTEESSRYAQKQLETLFKDLKKTLKETPIYLLSPLADGADRVTANVALKHDIKLIVPLPFEEEEYLKDFSAESKKSFEKLLAQSERKYFVGYHTQNSDANFSNRDAQYQAVGEHIAVSCNLLIALWDEKELNKIGGTTEIVKYKRKVLSKGLFDGLDGNAIQIIPINRKSNPIVQKLKELPKMEILGLNINTKEQYNELLIELNKANKTITIENTNNFLNEYFDDLSNSYSDIASKFQEKFNTSILYVVSAAWFAVLSLELLHNFHLNFTMFFYALAVIFAFGYFHFSFKNGDKQDKFIFFRGLSEALRVQMYWDKAGIKAKVSDYYLKKQYSKALWLKIALSNLIYQKKYILNIQDTINIESLQNQWINHQVSYFENAIEKREKSYKKLEKLEHFFYKLGLYASVATFGIFLYYYFQHSFQFLFHLGLFISGMSLVTAGFIGAKYIHLKGYKEEI